MRVWIVFSRDKPLRFLSHLDMIRLWERALRRAGLPLRYSQGYHPHPRLSLALPLAVGMTAEAEHLEVEFLPHVSAEVIRERLTPQLPAGLSLRYVLEAPPGMPSPAARVRGSEIEAEILHPPPYEEVQERVHRFLGAEAVPVEVARAGRKGRPQVLDLRKTVEAIEIGPWNADRGTLRFRISVAGRPALLLQVLGLGGEVGGSRYLLHRRQLFFAGYTD